MSRRSGSSPPRELRRGHRRELRYSECSPAGERGTTACRCVLRPGRSHRGTRVLRHGGAGSRTLERVVRQAHRPRNGPIRPRLRSASQAQACPDPRLTSSPGSPGSPARPASPCTEREVTASGHATLPLRARGSGPGTRPVSPSRPAALAVLGHLWLPVETGQEATRASGSRQVRLKEDGRRPGVTRGAHCGTYCCWGFHTHRLSHQVSSEASRGSL